MRLAHVLILGTALWPHLSAADATAAARPPLRRQFSNAFSQVRASAERHSAEHAADAGGGVRVPQGAMGAIQEGLTWLEGDQNADGSWGATLELIVTSTVIEALNAVDPTHPSRDAAAEWLADEVAPDHDALSRQLSALAGVAGFEGTASALTAQLLDARNPATTNMVLPNWPEGGWGLAPGFESDCQTTALALKALDAMQLNGGFAAISEPIAAGATHIHQWQIPGNAVKVRIQIIITGPTVRLRMKQGSPPTVADPFFQLAPGINWLITFPDNGLPFTPGTNYISIQNLGAAGSYTMTASFETPTLDTRDLAEALSYLRQSQNPDGGWGLQRGQPTEFYTTLHVLLTLLEYSQYDFSTHIAAAIAFVEAQQLGDGSFGFSGTPVAYVTALAALNLVRGEAYPFNPETEDAIDALLAMQAPDGSWDEQPYDTALAMLALWDHNQPPTVNAGPDQMVIDGDGNCFQAVVLTASGNDVDGTVTAYAWTEDGELIASGFAAIVTLEVGHHVIMATVTDNEGKSMSDTLIVDVASTGVPSDVCHCCAPDAECQDLAPQECVDLSYTPVPGACALQACCLANDTCALLDAQCCLQQGGLAQGIDTACAEPGPCCMPDGTCQTLDPLCCVVNGGFPGGVTGKPPPPDPMCTAPEACCLPGQGCVDLDPLCCTDSSGAPQGPGSACTSVQACCLTSGSCTDVEPECCDDLGGVASGPGTSCSMAQACCLPDQTCQTLDPQCCSDQGGTPLGGAATCAAPQACCLPDGSCVDAASSCCDNLGGTPQGAASQCSASDTDGDGDDNTCDGDDDNDGVADGSDAAPLNPESCQDADNDTCDDCAVGSDGFGPRPDNDPANDGPDADGDGICDAGETCANFTACADDDDNGVRDDACKWWACAAGICQGTNIAFADIGGQFGSCPPDGASDGNDRFHALNCFSNQNTAGGSGYLCEPAPPNATNADAGGPFGQCCPDGVCDGNDAFHALNAFSGTNACSCPANFVCPCPAPTDPPGNPVLCPPSPAPNGAAATGPEVVAEAGVILRPSTRFVQPGGQVDVQVLLAGALADLRGYQLHVAASGGRRGALRLTDMTIEKQAGHVFADRAFWQAFNLDTQQVLAGLDDVGIQTRPQAYLATFTFQASPDAAGAFTVNLLHDDSDRTQRTFLFPTPAGAKIAIDSVDPAVIVVEPHGLSRRER